VGVRTSATARLLGVGIALTTTLGPGSLAQASLLAQPARARPSPGVTTLLVTTVADGPAARHGCSLRGALAAAEGGAPRDGEGSGCGRVGRGPVVIELPAGSYRLSRAGGALVVTGPRPVTITAAGPRGATLNAHGSGGRVLEVAGGAVVTLRDLTVTGGTAAGATATGGSAESCPPSSPAAYGVDPTVSGGGILNGGTLTLSGVTVAGNCAAGEGGGILSTGGRLTLLNTTLSGNRAADGGALAVSGGRALLRSVTVAGNAAGPRGAGGLSAPGGSVRLTDTIVAANVGAQCAANGGRVRNGGHDLGDGTAPCPGRRADPRLGPLANNGGPTATMAIAPSSPARHAAAGCPAADQRGVPRPHPGPCDVGALQYAPPQVTLLAPTARGEYRLGSPVTVAYRCQEGGLTDAIASCIGSVPAGHRLPDRHTGGFTFTVTATDHSGNRVRRTVRYAVWQYVNPVSRIAGLTPRRIDLGVDYAGSGPLLAIGRAVITFASNSDGGPASCWAISCWPGGGIAVYRLLDGPYAGKYVYVAEHITVTVHAGQVVTPGQQIATLYSGYPWSETGWAAGPGPKALGMADGHYCHPCADVGDWSTIEGRTMNRLLVSLGAPSGLFQAQPAQTLPGRWPRGP
jgi:hypothetical protein